MDNDSYEDFINFIMYEVSDEKIEELFNEMGIEINLTNSEKTENTL